MSLVTVGHNITKLVDPFLARVSPADEGGRNGALENLLAPCWDNMKMLLLLWQNSPSAKQFGLNPIHLNPWTAPNP